MRQWICRPLRDVAAINGRLDAVQELIERPELVVPLRSALQGEHHHFTLAEADQGSVSELCDGECTLRRSGLVDRDAGPGASARAPEECSRPASARTAARPPEVSAEQVTVTRHCPAQAS